MTTDDVVLNFINRHGVTNVTELVRVFPDLSLNELNEVIGELYHNKLIRLTGADNDVIWSASNDVSANLKLRGDIPPYKTPPVKTTKRALRACATITVINQPGTVPLSINISAEDLNLIKRFAHEKDTSDSAAAGYLLTHALKLLRLCQKHSHEHT